MKHLLHTFFVFVACSKPIANAQGVSAAEVATQEQIRSAACAMTAMPKRSLEALVAATKTYIKSKDSLELARAFEIDDVPTYIAQCFELHAKHSLSKGKSDRAFASFYDGAERALRLQLVIEVARRTNQSVETIRRLNDQMYESLYRFNRESS